MSYLLGRPNLLGDQFSRPFEAFLGGLLLLATLILMAACANLGSLFAARAADRAREVALRLALGSSRKRVLRGLFTEAIVVSMLGGVFGLWASVALLRWLSEWQPFGNFPMHAPVTSDAKVFAIALLLSLLSGLLFGAIPVRQVLRTSPYEVVKTGSSARTGRRITARDVLLAAQIAICAVLVTSSMVGLRGLEHAEPSQPKTPGPRSQKRVDMESSPRHPCYPGRQRDKCPDNGQKSSNENRQISPACKESIRPIELAPAHQNPSPIALHQGTSTICADLVCHQRSQIAPDRPRGGSPDQTEFSLEHEVARERHDQFRRQRDAGRFDRHEQSDPGVASRCDDVADEDEQEGEDAFGHWEAVVSRQWSVASDQQKH